MSREASQEVPGNPGDVPGSSGEAQRGHAGGPGGPGRVPGGCRGGPGGPWKGFGRFREDPSGVPGGPEACLAAQAQCFVRVPEHIG